MIEGAEPIGFRALCFYLLSFVLLLSNQADSICSVALRVELAVEHGPAGRAFACNTTSTVAFMIIAAGAVILLAL